MRDESDNPTTQMSGQDDTFHYTLTWRIWTFCPQPRFRGRDLHALVITMLVIIRTKHGLTYYLIMTMITASYSCDINSPGDIIMSQAVEISC